MNDCTVSSVANPALSRHPSPSISNTVLYDVGIVTYARNNVLFTCHWCKRKRINMCDLLPLVCERRTTERVVAQTKRDWNSDQKKITWYYT